MTAPVYTNTTARQLRRIPNDLLRSRHLLLDLISKEIRVRYRYAVMGFLWTILEPLFLMLVLTFILRYVFNFRFGEDASIASDAMQVLCALLAWQFFANGLATSTASIVDNRSLVTKVSFPREALPLASVGVALFHFILGAAVFVVLYTIASGLPAVHALAIPLLFCVQIAMVAGLGLLFSCLNASFRDISYIVNTGIFFGFYASPVFYSPAMVQASLPDFYRYYFINPMAGLITAYRQLLDGVWPSAGMLAWPIAFAAIALAAGLFVFRRSSPTLADKL